MLLIFFCTILFLCFLCFCSSVTHFLLFIGFGFFFFTTFWVDLFFSLESFSLFLIVVWQVIILVSIVLHTLFLELQLQFLCRYLVFFWTALNLFHICITWGLAKDVDRQNLSIPFLVLFLLGLLSSLPKGDSFLCSGILISSARKAVFLSPCSPLWLGIHLTPLFLQNLSAFSSLSSAFR